MTGGARAAHEVAGDDLTNLVCRLLDQQSAIHVDPDEPSCERATRVLKGDDFTE
jgi:hypothetical protein